MLQLKEYLDKAVDHSGFDFLLQNSDYVVNILPYTDKTEDYFDKKAFEKMKKDSIFINIGRGSTVNEEHLIEFLKNKNMKE